MKLFNFNKKASTIVVVSTLIAGAVEISSATNEDRRTNNRSSYHAGVMQDKAATTMMIVTAMSSAVKIKSGSSRKLLHALADDNTDCDDMPNPQDLSANHEEIMQCAIDTLELEKSSQKLMDAKAEYESAGLDTIFEATYAMDILDYGIITIDMPKDLKNDIMEECTEAGLNAIDMDDSYYSCSIFGPTLDIVMKNQVGCLAPTEECNTLDLEQLTIDTIAFFGIECNITSEITTAGSNDSLTNSTIIIGSDPTGTQDDDWLGGFPWSNPTGTQDDDDDNEAESNDDVVDDVFHQCVIDTLKMEKSSKELIDAQLAYEAAAMYYIIEQYDPVDSNLFSIDIPENVKSDYVEACTEAGLNALDSMDDSYYYSCTLYGKSIELELEMKNQACCVAPTEECDSMDIEKITVNTFALFGMYCITPSLAASASVAEWMSSSKDSSSSSNSDSTKHILLLLFGAVSMLYEFS